MWDVYYFLGSIVISYIFFTIIGVDIGLHRYYTHHSFKCNKFVESFIWLCTFLSGVSDPACYVIRHRYHHKYSDTVRDNIQVKYPIATWIGFNSKKIPDYNLSEISIADITKNKFYKFQKDYFPHMHALTVIIAMIINFKFAFYFFIVGGAIVYNLTSAVTVLCHMYGYQNFDTNDNSTNNTWVNALLLFSGVALHNNHHAIPYSYTHKVKSHEIDISAWIIKNILASSVNK